VLYSLILLQLATHCRNRRLVVLKAQKLRDVIDVPDSHNTPKSVRVTTLFFCYRLRVLAELFSLRFMTYILVPCQIYTAMRVKFFSKLVALQS